MEQSKPVEGAQLLFDGIKCVGNAVCCGSRKLCTHSDRACRASQCCNVCELCHCLHHNRRVPLLLRKHRICALVTRQHARCQCVLLRRCCNCASPCVCLPHRKQAQDRTRVDACHHHCRCCRVCTAWTQRRKGRRTRQRHHHLVVCVRVHHVPAAVPQRRRSSAHLQNRRSVALPAPPSPFFFISRSSCCSRVLVPHVRRPSPCRSRLHRPTHKQQLEGVRGPYQWTRGGSWLGKNKKSVTRSVK